MNLKALHKKYNTKKKCIKHLETIRWGRKVICPYCGSDNTVRLKKELRHHCNNKGCKRNFSVLIGTIFEHSAMPLPQWYQIIFLTITNKRGLAAKTVERQIGMSYKNAWYAMMRIRCAMIDNCNVLQNVVEMDEAYLKQIRKGRIKDNKANLRTVTTKRGRGTQNAVPIVGIVQRGGKIVLKVVEKVNSKTLMGMLKQYVNTKKTIVVTDEWGGYRRFDEVVEHLVIEHQKKRYVSGMIYTNTIEGFFSILKNSIRGEYVAISKKYLPFYLVHAAYIYNHRKEKNNANLFNYFIKDALNTPPQMDNYKPLKSPKFITEKKCTTKPTHVKKRRKK